MKNIKGFLDDEERKELLEAWHSGGFKRRKALERVMEAHEPLIKAQARLMAGHGVEQEDANQFMRLLAWETLQDWSPEHGAGWGHWLKTNMRPGSFYNEAQRMRQAPIRAPLTRFIKKAQSVLKKEILNFEQRHGREANQNDIEQIKYMLGIEKKHSDGINAGHVYGDDIDNLKEDIEDNIIDETIDDKVNAILKLCAEDDREFIIDCFKMGDNDKIKVKEIRVKYGLKPDEYKEKKERILKYLVEKAKDLE